MSDLMDRAAASSLTSQRIDYTGQFPTVISEAFGNASGQLSNERLLSGAAPRQAPWVGGLNTRLAELMHLPVGWDGSGARSISQRVIVATAAFLGQPGMASVATSPDIVPTTEGGLQIEWHTESIDLVLEILPGAAASALVIDREQGIETEGSIVSCQLELASALRRL